MKHGSVLFVFWCYFDVFTFYSFIFLQVPPCLLRLGTESPGSGLQVPLLQKTLFPLGGEFCLPGSTVDMPRSCTSGVEAQHSFPTEPLRPGVSTHHYCPAESWNNSQRSCNLSDSDPPRVSAWHLHLAPAWSSTNLPSLATHGRTWSKRSVPCSPLLHASE